MNNSPGVDTCEQPIKQQHHNVSIQLNIGELVQDQASIVSKHNIETVNDVLIVKYTL